jgi:cytochrome c peroxidase
MFKGLLRSAPGWRNACRPSQLGLTVIIVILTLITSRFAQQPPAAADRRTELNLLEQLGADLFVDVNLSRNRKQSCATCHDPEFAFSDPRTSRAGRAVSTGDDGQSLGDRNTPTLMYAHLTPPLTKRRDGKLAGGLFWDGRASTLEEQAKGPLLNPVEMGMPDAVSVAERCPSSGFSGHLSV